VRNSASSTDSISGKLRSRRGRRKHHAAALYARHQLRRVVHAESEAKAASAELGVVGAVGACPDAAEDRRPAAAWRHPDDKEVLAWRRWCVEKKRRWRVAKKKQWENSWRLECARFVTFIGRARVGAAIFALRIAQ
jgi:hypothetical protein